nr:hypothetical protein [uncultured Niameybacter sp.]
MKKYKIKQVVKIGDEFIYEYDCERCSNEAEYIGYGEEGVIALCEECKEVFLVANSLRMGVCAYEGESSDKYKL